MANVLPIHPLVLRYFLYLRNYKVNVLPFDIFQGIKIKNPKLFQSFILITIFRIGDWAFIDDGITEKHFYLLVINGFLAI